LVREPRSRWLASAAEEKLREAAESDEESASRRAAAWAEVKLPEAEAGKGNDEPPCCWCCIDGCIAGIARPTRGARLLPEPPRLCMAYCAARLVDEETADMDDADELPLANAEALGIESTGTGLSPRPGIKEGRGNMLPVCIGMPPRRSREDDACDAPLPPTAAVGDRELPGCSNWCCCCCVRNCA